MVETPLKTPLGMNSSDNYWNRTKSILRLRETFKPEHFQRIVFGERKREISNRNLRLSSSYLFKDKKKSLKNMVLETIKKI